MSILKINRMPIQHLSTQSIIELENGHPRQLSSQISALAISDVASVINRELASAVTVIWSNMTVHPRNQEEINYHISQSSSGDEQPSETVGWTESSKRNHTDNSYSTPALSSEEAGKPYLFGLAIVMCLTALTAIIGNCLVLLAIIKTRSLRRLNNFLLVSLAICDFSSAIICMPVFITELFNNDKWILPSELCPFYISLLRFFQFLSVCNIAAISLERVFIIKHPMMYQRTVTERRMFMFIVILWVISFTYGASQLYWFHTDPYLTWSMNNAKGYCRHFPAREYAITDFVFCFSIPLCIMLGAYLKIYCIVQSQMSRIHPKLSDTREDGPSEFSTNNVDQYTSQISKDRQNNDFSFTPTQEENSLDSIDSYPARKTISALKVELKSERDLNEIAETPINRLQPLSVSEFYNDKASFATEALHVDHNTREVSKQVDNYYQFIDNYMYNNDSGDKCHDCVIESTDNVDDSRSKERFELVVNGIYMENSKNVNNSSRVSDNHNVESNHFANTSQSTISKGVGSLVGRIQSVNDDPLPEGTAKCSSPLKQSKDTDYITHSNFDNQELDLERIHNRRNFTEKSQLYKLNSNTAVGISTTDLNQSSKFFQTLDSEFNTDQIPIQNKNKTSKSSDANEMNQNYDERCLIEIPQTRNNVECSYRMKNLISEGRREENDVIPEIKGYQHIENSQDLDGLRHPVTKSKETSASVYNVQHCDNQLVNNLSIYLGPQGHGATSYNPPGIMPSSPRASSYPATPTTTTVNTGIEININRASFQDPMSSPMRRVSSARPDLESHPSLDIPAQSESFEAKLHPVLKSYSKNASTGNLSEHNGAINTAHPSRKRNSVVFKLYDDEILPDDNPNTVQTIQKLRIWSRADNNTDGSIVATTETALTYDSGSASSSKKHSKDSYSDEPAKRHTHQWTKKHFNVIRDYSTTSLSMRSRGGSGVSSRGTSSLSRRLRENKAVRMTAAVIGAFLVCVFPYEVVFLMRAINMNSVSDLVWNVVNVVMFLSSALNPFIYNFYNSTFRAAIKRLIHCKGNPIAPE